MNNHQPGTRAQHRKSNVSMHHMKWSKREYIFYDFHVFHCPPQQNVAHLALADVMQTMMPRSEQPERSLGPVLNESGERTQPDCMMERRFRSKILFGDAYFELWQLSQPSVTLSYLRRPYFRCLRNPKAPEQIAKQEACLSQCQTLFMDTRPMHYTITLKQ